MTLPRAQRCELCVYWTKKHQLSSTPPTRQPGNEQGVAIGECQRFPTPHQTDPNYGCGEFRAQP